MPGGKMPPMESSALFNNQNLMGWHDEGMLFTYLW